MGMDSRRLLRCGPLSIDVLTQECSSAGSVINDISWFGEGEAIQASFSPTLTWHSGGFVGVFARVFCFSV